VLGFAALNPTDQSVAPHSLAVTHQIDPKSASHPRLHGDKLFGPMR
jgi:hypothetical protein